jgi:membrane protein insertase Oxa1/YidC/SpoIIIJ
MMVYMPAMFGLMLYNYAAGVHLYQFTSSLLGIFEQKFLRKRFLPAPEPVPAPRKGKGRG